jgi:hypothetical protein
LKFALRPYNRRMNYDETTPDIGSMSDEELKALIDELADEEREVSYRRRVLHGKIDILRAELVNRLKVKRESGDAAITEPGGVVVALHCPECGFVNPEGANYCQKCGAFLGRPEGEDPTTMTYKVDETGEYTPIDIDEEVDKSGAALVIRSGGGRAGESFTIDQERMSIGRTPDAAVFLDDVTVSRNHALLVYRQDGHYIDDLGSLNGTYVNRRRIESHRLEDGDEIQIGKYKLSYLEK